MSEAQNSTRDTVAFILPLFVFLVIGSFYPDFAQFSDTDDPDNAPLFSSATRIYVGMVGIQVIIASGLILYFHRVYLRHFPLKVSPWSVVVGVVGIVLWIGVCELHIEKEFFGAIGLKSLVANRPAFNPFESIADNGFRSLFLALRFALLAILVPIIEELFLRGWLVRWINDPDWETVSLKTLSWTALLTPSCYGVMTHPSEAIAAFLWFGLVTVLMRYTGNLWDCIVAHAVTNLLLGIYVIQYSAWELW
jgi:CAAX prenyl protease-like protein